MKAEVVNAFIRYWHSLQSDIPIEIYEGLISVLCLAIVLMLALYGLRKGLRYSSRVLLLEYVFLIYCSTLIYRACGETRGHDFSPFWSYVAIFDGRVELLPENIMNVVVFMPVGLILGCAFRSITWWKVLFISGGLSISIETMQFFLKKGFAETDDVMHNILGCMIGYGIYKMSELTYRYAK